MNIVVTGASGFVGQALVHRLLSGASPGPLRQVEKLTLVDIAYADLEARPLLKSDKRLRLIEGSIAEESVLDRALEGRVDAVFHLACIPGGAAERDYALGRAVNLNATLSLLEKLRTQSVPPRVVFASSVAVYGEHLPVQMDESSLPAPALTYGAHKLIGEILVADATRLGWITGCSLRLPGVVARPQEPSGLISAFMSNLIWAVRDGKPIEIPVSKAAVAWWISVGRCAENLMHAVSIERSRLGARCAYTMPVLRLTMGEVVEALARRFGEDRSAFVSYNPDERIERLFGAYPRLNTPTAWEMGFRHDGNAETLVANAMNP